MEIITEMKNAGPRKLSCNGPRAWHEIMKRAIFFLSVLSPTNFLVAVGGSGEDGGEGEVGMMRGERGGDKKFARHRNLGEYEMRN